MHTIESSFIMPVTFFIVIYILFFSMRQFDSVVENNMEYGFLINQLSCLHSQYENEISSISPSEISSAVYSTTLLSDKPVYTSMLSGENLYLYNNNNKSKVYTEYINHSEILRKESAISMQKINKWLSLTKNY